MLRWQRGTSGGAIRLQQGEEFNGVVPDDPETLLTFWGIGRKTCMLTLQDVHNMKAMGIAFDTHLAVVSFALGWCN